MCSKRIRIRRGGGGGGEEEEEEEERKMENLSIYNLLNQQDTYIQLVDRSITSNKIEVVVKKSVNKEEHRTRVFPVAFY